MANDTMGIEEVCRLPEAELRARIAELRSELLPRVERARRGADGAAIELDFAATDELRARLEALVAFERQCCDGIGWDLTSADGAHRLVISGLSDDSPFFRALGLD